MPKVPTLNTQRVQETQGPTNQVSTNTPNGLFDNGAKQIGQFGEAAKGVSDKYIKIQKEEKEKADQIEAMAAIRKMAEAEVDVMHNPETGVLSSKGKNAFGASDKGMEDFDQRVQSISTDLNPRQLELVNQTKARTEISMLKRGFMHESKQAQAYDLAETQAYVEAERQAAVASYNYPNRLAESINKQKEAIFRSADRNGVSDKVRDNLVAKNVSDTQTEVIKQMLADDKETSAKKYFKVNKKDFLPTDVDDVKNMLESATLRGDSQRNTDSILAKTDDMKTALDMANKIKDPEQKDATRTRLKSRFADRRAAKKDSEVQNFNSAYQMVEKYETMDKVPDHIKNKLSLSNKKALEKRAQELRSGIASKTDLDVYYNLELMAGNPATRSKFLQTNLLEKKAYLSESDFKHFATLQKNTRSGKGTKELDGIESKNSIVNSSLSLANIDLSKKAKDKDKAAAMKFRAEVDKLVVQKQDTLGRKINNEELRGITSELMTDILTSDGGILGFFQEGIFGAFDGRKKAFEIDSEDELLIDLEDIPDNDVRGFEAALIKKKIPVTEERIIHLYKQRIKKMRGFNGK